MELQQEPRQGKHVPPFLRRHGEGEISIDLIHTYLCVQAETPAGRCLVFANHLQHKVREMHNKSNEVGVRKILCFFLVDPDHRYGSALSSFWGKGMHTGLTRYRVERMKQGEVLGRHTHAAVGQD